MKKIDGYEFGCFKRVFKDNATEFWRSLFLDEIGSTVEDNIVILWATPITKVVLFSNSQERMNSVEYLDLIFGLFHSIAEYEFISIFQENPTDNKIEEQILIANSINNKVLTVDDSVES